MVTVELNLWYFLQKGKNLCKSFKEQRRGRLDYPLMPQEPVLRDIQDSMPTHRKRYCCLPTKNPSYFPHRKKPGILFNTNFCVSPQNLCRSRAFPIPNGFHPSLS